MALKSETLVDNYIILEEAKIQKIRLETREGAHKYEEKGRRENGKEIITECWRQVKEKEYSKRWRWKSRKRAVLYEKRDSDGRSKGNQDAENKEILS